MNWIELNSLHQLTEIKEFSQSRAQVIFKHSTRCSLSAIAKSRLERIKQPDATDFYFLDLIKFRSLSNKIAEDFAIPHESPQILLIKNMVCVYEESHNGINMAEIAAQVNSN